ncbi:hypothetical protein DNTS_015332 [Danionella cerebrum]|uniref:BHLH domain-containing protein n=1 Tax=Danionella cerebrum TaxID=2873325 RepID=A0A553NWS9_9TELE|nr:hypothetical protein DNTS_015332 [Danionella translucida]
MMIPPSGDNTLYVGRKRRRPIQKQRSMSVSSCTWNPSKRHRERLNTEIKHLADLLPLTHSTITHLDKLSVLRLSVGYLRLRSCLTEPQETPSTKVKIPVPEGQLLLQSLPGFPLLISGDGVVLYASSTITEYLGFQQTDVMLQSVFGLVHVEDHQELRRQLHWAMKPEDSSGDAVALCTMFRRFERGGVALQFHCFLQRCFNLRVRSLLDCTTGFLPMRLQGRLRFLQSSGKSSSSDSPGSLQLALFCVAEPLLRSSVSTAKRRNFEMRNRHRNPSIIHRAPNRTNSVHLCTPSVDQRLLISSGSSHSSEKLHEDHPLGFDLKPGVRCSKQDPNAWSSTNISTIPRFQMHCEKHTAQRSSFSCCFDGVKNQRFVLLENSEGFSRAKSWIQPNHKSELVYLERMKQEPGSDDAPFCQHVRKTPRDHSLNCFLGGSVS